MIVFRGASRYTRHYPEGFCARMQAIKMLAKQHGL